MNKIFKIKRKDGTYSVIAVQFNDYNSIRMVVLKGSNPFFDEVFSIIFSYTEIIPRMIREKLKRVFHSKVCRHNGMSATYLWIEYGKMKKKEPDDFTDYSFKDIITGVQRTKKLQISGSNKLDGFTFYILDLIDFAIELNVLKYENGVISKGSNFIEVDVDIIEDKTSTFVHPDIKNEIYQAVVKWEINETLSVNNDETNDKIYFNDNGVALNGEDTYEFDENDETIFSDVKQYGLTEREILLCAEYSENLNEINESHLPPSYIQYVIDRCVKDIDNHTECYDNDIDFLKKCNIEKYNGQIKAIIEKNDEIKSEISETIDNIIESDMREYDIVRSMINGEPVTYRECETEDDTEDETPSNILKITLNN